MNVNPDWYRYFLAVAQTNSFTEGANTLNITQSALSQGIRNLEEALGARLLHRSVKGTTLSTEGKVLLPYVADAMQSLSLAEQELQEHRSLEKGHLTLGVGDTICKYYLLPHIESFHNKYPGIRISIINRTSGELLELLEARTLDIAIVTSCYRESPEVNNSIESKPLFEIEDCFACAPNLIKRAENSEPGSLIWRNPLLLPSHRTATRKNLEMYLSAQSISLPEIIDFESVDLQIEFAIMGMGTVYAPYESMKKQIKEKTLVHIPITPEIPKRQAWGLYYRKPSPRIRCFIEEL